MNRFVCGVMCCALTSRGVTEWLNGSHWWGGVCLVIAVVLLVDDVVKEW